jgi:hypothetical protein
MQFDHNPIIDFLIHLNRDSDVRYVVLVQLSAGLCQRKTMSCCRVYGVLLVPPSITYQLFLKA